MTPRQAAGGADVPTAGPGRAYLPAHRFEPLARNWVATTLEPEDRETRQTVIYRLGA